MRESGPGSLPPVDGIRRESEFTQEEEEEWFEAGEALMDREHREHIRKDEERANVEGVEHARREIGQLEEQREPEEHHDAPRQADVAQKQEREPSSLFSRVAEKVWQDTMYPTQERVVKLGLAGMGFMSGSIGFSLAEASFALRAGLAGGGLALGAFAVAELALRRHRKVDISSLMILYKVFEKDTDGRRKLAGEIHLGGKEALKRLHNLPLRDKRRTFLSDTQYALEQLQQAVQSGDRRLQNVKHFFGVTEVFSRAELEQLGFAVTEEKQNVLDRALRYLGKKMLRVHTMGRKGLFRPMKNRPLYRIQFTREQMAAATIATAEERAE